MVCHTVYIYVVDTLVVTTSTPFFRVESLGRLHKQAESGLLDELVTHAVGGRGTGGFTRKRTVKSRLRQVVSVTTQVALSRRVIRFKMDTPRRWARRGLLDS
ncbi:unnamed protein product [Choristocarpus tenellus]